MEITMDQVRELSDRYEQCALGETSPGRFLRSIVISGNMPRGGGVKWLEDLVVKGNPESLAPLVAEIEGLISRTSRDDTRETLIDILRRVRAGQSITNHKQSELERLRKQVNDALPDLELDERSRLLLAGLGARKHYSSYSYWASRPVISSRLDDIFRRWGNHGKISPDDWEFVRENFKGPISEFEDGRHPVGALRWSRSGVPVTIMGAPEFDGNGNVIIEVLSPHGTFKVNMKGLRIRAPK